MLPLRALFERFRWSAPIETIRLDPLGLDLLDPAFIANPYPFYAQLREQDPIHRTRAGAWLITRYQDVCAALSHPGLSNAPSSRSPLRVQNAAVSSAADVAQNILPFLDKPRHIRSRRMVGSVWRRVLRERTPNIAHRAAVLLRGAAPHLDLCADYARPLSIWTMSELLALPASDANILGLWGEQFFSLFAPFSSRAALEQTDAALSEFRAYLLERLQERRRAPGDDVLSALCLARDEDGALTDLEVVDHAMLLFADGLGNVDRAFANLVLALIQAPACLQSVRRGEVAAERAIAEGLRYDPPGQVIARVARDDIVLAGVTIPRNAAVLLALGSANRDQRHYSEPDRFRLDRPEQPNHLAFGLGRHACLGAPLVQRQLVSALSVLLANSKGIQLADSRLSWEPRFGHRWLSRLSVDLQMQ